MLNFIIDTVAKGVFIYTFWYGFTALFWILLQ
jgi:hypothetical protein